MSWVELIDPSNNSCFFANLETGECDWELPVGAKLREKDPNQDEWWELFDENHKLHYYYNTKTMETVWDPPQSNIIPLAKLQKVMKDREDNGKKRQSTLIFTPNLKNLQKTKQTTGNSGLILEDATVPKTYLHGISRPQNDPEAAKKMKDQMIQGYKEDLKKLPNELITDIQNFSISGFAEKYFSKHKRGFIFRKEIPIQELLKFQTYNLSKPLMIQSENFKKDGLKCFKYILAVIIEKFTLDYESKDKF